MSAAAYLGSEGDAALTRCSIQCKLLLIMASEFFMNANSKPDALKKRPVVPHARWQKRVDERLCGCRHYDASRL